MKHQRAKLAPMTQLRVSRLQAGITIDEVSARSGLTTYRISIFERHPTAAHCGELEAHRAAIDAIVAERLSAHSIGEGAENDTALIVALTEFRRREATA